MGNKNTINDIELTDKQIRFCEEYVIDWNGTRAAIAAGYSEHTAHVIANENLRKPKIKEHIDKVKNELERLAGLSKLKILLEHKKLAFSSIANLHDSWIERKDFELLTDDQRECIQEISTKVVIEKRGDRNQEVEYVKIRLYDKQKSLDAISKLMGYDSAQKLEHTGKDGKDLSFLGFLMSTNIVDDGK